MTVFSISRTDLCHRTDFAVSLGPVIGGVIAQEIGWRWIFWFLVILTGSHFLIVLLFLPETQRNIVGDGSGKARGVYWSFFSVLQKHEKDGPSTHIMKPMRHYPNPFACLPILANKQSLIVILLYSITYAVKMTLQASLGAQCVEIYQLDYLSAGLIYLPSGVSGGVGAFCTGEWRNNKPTHIIAYIAQGGFSITITDGQSRNCRTEMEDRSTDTSLIFPSRRHASRGLTCS